MQTCETTATRYKLNISTLAIHFKFITSLCNYAIIEYQLGRQYRWAVCLSNNLWASRMCATLAKKRNRRFYKRVREKKTERKKKNPASLIYNWNGEQNECEAVKPIPPICCALGQRQAAICAWICFNICTYPREKDNLDNKHRIILSAIIGAA